MKTSDHLFLDLSKVSSSLAYEDAEASSPPLFVQKGEKSHYPTHLSPVLTEEGKHRRRLNTESDAKLHKRLSKTLPRGATSLNEPSKMTKPSVAFSLSKEHQSKEIKNVQKNKSYNIVSRTQDQTSQLNSFQTSLAKEDKKQEHTKCFTSPKENKRERTRCFTAPSTMPSKEVVSNEKDDLNEEKDDLYEEIIDDVRYENLRTLRTEVPPLPYRSRKEKDSSSAKIPIRPQSVSLESSYEVMESLPLSFMYVNERRMSRSESPGDQNRESSYIII